MSQQYIGCSVSVQVGGGLGFYQGTVKNVSASNQFITLTKVLHNGKPTNKPEVTINAEDILDLKILNKSELKSEESIQVTKKENKDQDTQSTSLSENKNKNLVINKKVNLLSSFNIKEQKEAPPVHTFSSNSKKSSADQVTDQIESLSVKESNFATGQSHFKKKSRTSVGELLAGGSHFSEYRNVARKSSFNSANSLQHYDYGYQRKSADNQQLKRQWNKQWQNLRDESTFGTPIDEDLFNTEFDFEKNLALFDKQAVMEEIQNLKPDVIRQADKKIEKKYRCDENILDVKPQPKRQIMVPASEAGEIIYATDSGLLVPSVSTELRLNLLSTANQFGLTKSRQLEMIGRGATEIIISVIGGSHRLEPGNSHQAPVVVLLCGANTQGAAGVNCGRQLESQGVQTIVVTPPLPSPSSSLLLFHEVQLYNMTSRTIKTNVTSLPSTVDLIVDARFDLLGNLGLSNQGWVNETNAWASVSRAPIVALDPPSNFALPFNPRIRLCPSLPLAYLSEKGKVYLINLNIPQQVFTSLDIKYTSPFGAKMVVPLHPCE